MHLLVPRVSSQTGGVRLVSLRVRGSHGLEKSQLLTRIACVRCMHRIACETHKNIVMVVWNVFCVMERVEEHEDHGYEHNESSSLAYA